MLNFSQKISLNMIPKNQPRFGTIEKLEEKSTVNIALTKYKIEDLIMKLKDIQKNVEESRKKVDMEVEFIYLNRYFDLLNKATNAFQAFNRKNYPKQFQVTKQYLERYQQLRPVIETWYAKSKRCETAIKSIQNKNITVGSNYNMIDSIPCAVEKDVQNGNTPSLFDEDKDFVTIQELYRLLSNEASKFSVLILDVRSSREFKESKLKPHVPMINIPSEIIDKRLSAAKLREQMDPNMRPMWDERNKYERLILLDWYSSTARQRSDLTIMIKIITDWDPNTTYKCKKPQYIDGGFEEILSQYPTLITNTNVAIPEASESNSDTPVSLGSFQYPDIDSLNEPRKEVKSQLHASESFDRSLKPKLSQPNLILSNASLYEPPSISDIESPSMSDNIIESSDANMNIPDTSSDEEISVKMDDSSLRPIDLDEMRKHKPHFEPSRTLNNSEKSNFEQREFNKPSFIRSRDADSDSETNYTTLKVNESNPPSNINKQIYKTPSKPDDNEAPSYTRSNKPSERTDLIYGSYSTQGLTGLKNFANNCYMNSIIQCLSNTQPLVEALIGSKNSFEFDGVKFNPKSRTKGKIASKVNQAFMQMWRGVISVYSLFDLKEEMGAIKDIFKGSAHQDSNEFLIILLEHLHEDLKMAPELGVLAGAREETGEKAWGEFKEKNTSIIQKLFYGQQKSTVSCTSCNYTSVTFEQFFNLFAPLPASSGTVSLTECIRLYMAGERISGWKCPTCKTERNATKKFDISILPRILVIALKRFTQDDDCWLHKKENIVSYPLTDLDMSSFIVPGSEQRFHKYDLYAMSIHSGTLKSGHYRAICQNHITNKWYMFDDQSIEHLPPSAVENNSEVYILFYKAVKD